MLQVPRPAVGLRVEIPDTSGKPCIYQIAEVDYIRRVYSAKPFADATDKTWKIDLSIDKDYHPVADRVNFERALEEWDYFYNMSDDDNVVDIGRVQERALIKMFRALPDTEQMHYRKLIAIATHVDI